MSDINTETENIETETQEAIETQPTSEEVINDSDADEGIMLIEESEGEAIPMAIGEDIPTSEEVINDSDADEGIMLIEEPEGEAIPMAIGEDVPTSEEVTGEVTEAIDTADTTDLSGETGEDISTSEEVTGEVTEAIDTADTTDLSGEIVLDEDGELILDENSFSLDDFEVDEEGNLILNEEQLQALMGEQTAETSEPVEMSMTFLGISIVQFIVAIMLMSIVLQQSKSASTAMSSGPVGASESYWSQNKGRSEESKLSRITVGLSVLFFALTLALGFLK